MRPTLLALAGLLVLAPTAAAVAPEPLPLPGDATRSHCTGSPEGCAFIIAQCTLFLLVLNLLVSDWLLCMANLAG